MRSTMPSYPLTVGSVVRHAVAVHGDRQTTTLVAPGEVRRVSYAELGERAGRLANALRELGIVGDGLAHALAHSPAGAQDANPDHDERVSALQSAGE